MDDLLTRLYRQRDGVVERLVKEQRIPRTDAEILVDKAIETAIKAQERGRPPTSSIWRELAPWIEAYRRHPEMVTWDENQKAGRERKRPSDRAE